MAVTTWNPSDKHASIVLSESNMRASFSINATGCVRATASKSSDKIYFEIKCLAVHGSNLHSYGIGTSSASLSSHLGADAHGYGYFSDGRKAHFGSYTSFGASFTVPDVIGVAIDFPAQKMWLAKNNVWQASGNPAAGTNPAFTGVSGTFFAMISLCSGGSNTSAKARFGYGFLSYAPPAGFDAYDPPPRPPVSSISLGGLSPKFASSTVRSLCGLVGVEAPVPTVTPNILVSPIEIGVSPIPPVSTPHVFVDPVEIGVTPISPLMTPNIQVDPAVIGTDVAVPYGTNVIIRSHSLLNSYLNFIGVRSTLVGLGETIDQLVYTPIAQTEVQLLINKLASHISNLQSAITQLTDGDPLFGEQKLLTSLQSEVGYQSLINELSELKTKIQVLLTSLTESFTHRTSIISELALKNDIQSTLALIGSLSDQSALYPDCTISVYLNGKAINRQIREITLVMDRESLFDTVSLGSIDELLYADILSIVGSEDSVIEVQYKGTSWSFLVEDLSGNELSFTVWGRSIAAKSDTPFKESSDYVVETEILASSLAAILVPDLAITWNVIDWTIPVGWSTSGTPVQMLQDLANNIGAVVRMFPDGTGLYVDERYITRPITLPFGTAVEYFDREVELISLTSSAILGTKVNSVTVYGYSLLDQYSVTLEADSCVVVGNNAEIKVYPALGGVGYVLKSSGGVPAYQYKGTSKHIETITFVGGKGSVQYPIVALESITWDGATPLGFDFDIGQSEIVLTDDTVAAIGEVVYFTSYDVWAVGHSGEGQLVVVYLPEEGCGIVARVYFGEGDREAEDLNRSALTSIEAAVAAGMAFLDNNSYTKLIRSIQVPCSGVLDGDVVSIQSEPSGVTGNAIVMKHEISAKLEGGALKIYSNIDAVQFEV